ncbi:MAG TPA: hypothetical protein VGG74_04890 [Kofleriaceae bacterium]|jgi:hypothetical protein
MGAALCWVAVRGKTRDTVLDELALTGTGDIEDIPESPLVGARLADGWYLVVSNEDLRFEGQDLLARLSSNCEAVTCFVDEHVMFSAAYGWRAGEQQWSIVHDSARSIEHLAAGGELPAEFAAIRDRLAAEQQRAGGQDAEVDFIFAVPVEVAKALTGFSHDEDVDGAAFEVLTNSAV